MTDNEIKSLVVGELKKLAPEVDAGQIDPTIDLREQIDLDSMDLLNLMIAIHEATGVEIPEADYPRMATLNGCVAYLRTRIETK
ncbi:MAG TPA: acyl carrier protein [Candidatus Binataceae bacterium]|nr:acyl carrier protein [Candidatus Binataceae bacterium]